MTALEKANADLESRSIAYWMQNEQDIVRDVKPEDYEDLQKFRRAIANGTYAFPTAEELVALYHEGYDPLFLAHLTDPLVVDIFAGGVK